MNPNNKDHDTISKANKGIIVLLTCCITICTMVFAKTAEYRQPIASIVTKSLNTSYQLSVARDGMVSYSVQITSVLNLAVGQSGSVNLQTSPNNSTWTTIATQTNNNNGALTLGLTTNVQSGSLTGFVPAGYYVKLTTSGTSAFAWQSGMEVLL